MVALLLILISLLVIPAAPAVADAPQATTTEVTAYGVGAGVDLDQFRAAIKHIKALHKIPSAQIQSTTLCWILRRNQQGVVCSTPSTAGSSPSNSGRRRP